MPSTGMALTYITVHLTDPVISVGRTKISLTILQMLSQLALFCILLTRTITKRGVAWIGFLQPELCTVSLGTWNIRNFKPQFLVNGKRL